MFILLQFQLGGTIGDIEGMPFVEAFRQFQFRVKRENFCCVHVSLVPQVCMCLVIYFPLAVSLHYFFIFIVNLCTFIVNISLI